MLCVDDEINRIQIHFQKLTKEAQECVERSVFEVEETEPPVQIVYAQYTTVARGRGPLSLYNIYSEAGVPPPGCPWPSLTELGLT